MAGNKEPVATPLLDRIHMPSDLWNLSINQLEQLARELRAETIDIVSETGGHLGSSLAVVELTIALHAIFRTPHDRLIWDVGHQSYPHKILTGRRARMRTIRQGGGLAGFTMRNESDYDPFGAGHSSTSISAGLGMAVARDLSRKDESGEDRAIVCVIGDGAMSAGMAYEGMNNAGGLKARMIVILNDNDMSIAPPTGALTRYLSRLISSRSFLGLRDLGLKLAGHLSSRLERKVRRTEEMARSLVTGSTLFDDLGFYHVGPIDGHDLNQLVPVLRNLREADIDKPILLHVVTQKGKDFVPAENNAEKLHAVGRFDVATGVQEKGKPGPPKYQDVFARALIAEAEQDSRIVAITAAMPSGTSLDKFAARFPSRCFDVGIAEQHAVTFAAGLAAEGMVPFCAIYSTFLQRAYDQLIHDVALQNLPVAFAIDRGGLVGGDGATHQGAFDLSYLRCIPNMVVMAPADENECRQMLYPAVTLDQPAAVRYPRGQGPGVHIEKEMSALPVGRAEVRREGRSGLLLLAFGTMVAPCVPLAERLDATLVNMRFVKPLDEELLCRLAARHDCIITLEENAVAGGAGSAVAECLAANGIERPVHHIGIPDRFIEHGSREDCLAMANLDAAGIARSIARLWPAQPAVLAAAGSRPGAA